jgi:hypothetical protein
MFISTIRVYVAFVESPVTGIDGGTNVEQVAVDFRGRFDGL